MPLINGKEKVMEQMFRVFLLDPKTGKDEVLVPGAYECESALGTHSFIGEAIVGAAYRKIENHPMKIAWIGHRAMWDSNSVWVEAARLTPVEFGPYFDKAWRSKSVYDPARSREIRHSQMFFFFRDEMYLINHTEKQYVDLKAYIAENSDAEGRCRDPLSILTACGNGQGHDDYTGRDRAYAGGWAMHTIECCSKAPAGYGKVSFYFETGLKRAA